MKNELQNIISGKSQVKHGAVIQTITSYIRRSAQASGVVEQGKYFKKQETEITDKK